MADQHYDANEVLGDEDKCYKCPEKPVATLKQIQEWEYRDEDKENQKIKTTMFLCKGHHNLMIIKGEEML